MSRLSSIAERMAKSFLAVSGTLYHGVSKEAAGKSIILDGTIKSGDLEGRSGYLTPVAGRVYLAQNLRYAVIYTTGANMLGEDIPLQYMGDRYGYLFVIRAEDMREGQPDEDDIGQLIYNGAREIEELGGMPNQSSKCPWWLMHMAKTQLTPRQYHKVTQGEYIYWAQAGKKLVKRMTPSQKRQLIDSFNVNIASLGDIPFREAWRFDKTKNPMLKRDASNFFELAERVR